MKYVCPVLTAVGMWLGAIALAAFASPENATSLERRFRELPMDA